MVEPTAVNRLVAGSIPAPGAMKGRRKIMGNLLYHNIERNCCQHCTRYSVNRHINSCAKMHFTPYYCDAHNIQFNVCDSPTCISCPDFIKEGEYIIMVEEI